MVIGDDPKYRQISNQGICSLEIRKPCSFDGGVYTCRAKNAQGEATVSCKLEVKRMYLLLIKWGNISTFTLQYFLPKLLWIIVTIKRHLHQFEKQKFF